MPKVSHLIQANEISWGGVLPINYPTNPMYDPQKIADMTVANEQNCDVVNPQNCDKSVDGEFYKNGTIKPAFINKYINPDDSEAVKILKRGVNKFRINHGYLWDNPSPIVEFILDRHWVVSPCPPLCIGGDEEEE